MTYLLNTDTLSHFSRGHPKVLERIKETPPAEVAISSVTLMEIEYGLALQPDKARKLRPVLEAFLGAIRVLVYDDKDAKATAVIRAALKTKGTPIGAYDALIAGTALSKGLILVTGNTREYKRIGGLRLENWT
jgi:tRNA(fMet)-specific endonuclease VapC